MTKKTCAYWDLTLIISVFYVFYSNFVWIDKPPFMPAVKPNKRVHMQGKRPHMTKKTCAYWDLTLIISVIYIFYSNFVWIDKPPFMPAAKPSKRVHMQGKRPHITKQVRAFYYFG